MLEVEIKASLAGIPAEDLLCRALAAGFVPGEQVKETDMYFNGAQRDFRRTDEALRLRSVCSLPDGPCESLLTYKGPKLDQVSSTRTEYETVVSQGETTEKILEALGYRAIFTVEKVRRTYRKDHVTLCLDDVAGLGQFLELETLAPAEEYREKALEEILGLLDRLGVPQDQLTRLSYLEMLIRKCRSASSDQ